MEFAVQSNEMVQKERLHHLHYMTYTVGLYTGIYIAQTRLRTIIDVRNQATRRILNTNN